MLVSTLALAIAAVTLGPATQPGPAAGRVKAFCIDFNWGPGGINAFAGPGVWADASPEEHVAWYAGIGCNTIQTFAVSCNGYAWYKGGIVPPQPGLKHDFLTEVVKLGHARGMKVMGYFCVGANTRWGQEHPDLSYGVPAAPHIPFTTEYLDFLAASIADALKKTDMDGFMIDWVWCPGFDGATKWLQCEQTMYEELMSKPFPSKEKVTPELELAFQRKAIDRCWERIGKAAKAAKPNCVIWLSCSNVKAQSVVDSKLFKEVDWLMNEATDPRVMQIVRRAKGPKTQLVQCVVGWGAGHDARKIVLDPDNRAMGLYGFAAPGPRSLPQPVAAYKEHPISSFEGNDRNIAVLARFYNGQSVEEVVTPDSAGTVELSPPSATILGESPIVAEGQIGHWEDGKDSVRWRFRTDKAGSYAVSITYACIEGWAGRRIEVRVDRTALKTTSAVTGRGWRDYEDFKLGKVTLGSGEHTLTVKPLDIKDWRPVSLKAVRLSPAGSAGP